MKALSTYFSLAVMGMTILSTSLYSCKESIENKPLVVEPANVIESTSLVGLWQKESEVVVVDDENAEGMTVIEPTNLYKCILPDGTFFLFRASTDPKTGVNTSSIELYGTYSRPDDTLYVETITSHRVHPELSGLKSDIHYNMADKDLMNVWYNIKAADGSQGSNEWTPEVWRRVGSAQ